VPSSISLPAPLQETFRVLGLRSNSASVQVLAMALSSPFEQIRVGALQTLIQRGGEAEMAAILERIDYCNDSELPLLANQVSLLMAPIEAGLASRDPLARQRSLIAISKLQVASQFQHLVLAAQSPDDPQQIVAAELLLGLAVKYGFDARQKSPRGNAANRAQLLSVLWQSMLNFNDHKILQIVDAWLCAAHWDDQPFKDLLTPVKNESIYKVAFRQLKVSNRLQIAELLAGVLWSQGPRPEALQSLGDRTDNLIVTKLAELVVRFGVTPIVSKNLRTNIPIACLDRFDFSRDAFSIAYRCAILQLLSNTDCSPDKVLDGVTHLLQTKDPAAEQACCTALRSLRSLKPEIVVMVLSDCFEMPGMEPYQPPPWKANLRSALERLIELAPHQTSAIRSSIECAFSEFRCEELIKHLDDWPESHLRAYAQMITISETTFVQFIEREATSQSQVKRMRALHAIRFLGVTNGLVDVVIDALQDKSEKVRIEAIHAIATGHTRQEAIDILRPLIEDDDQTVQTAAKFALSRLES
jgi:hypothetical protein